MARLSISLLLLSLAGCGSNLIGGNDGAIPTVDGGPVDTGTPGFSDGGGIGITELTLSRVVPPNGPFTGGNEVVLRGSGFSADARVSFDGRDVQPADHRLIDDRRLAVVVPAGEPGPADVTITLGADTVTLEGGYTYDVLTVEPTSGSVAGGTFVTLTATGTDFADGDQVFFGEDAFGRNACRDVRIVSPTVITCRTPAFAAGIVSVFVRRGSADLAVAADAYTYFDSTDPYAGGLGGGPSEGSINLTVINAATGEPEPDAFAIVGESLSTEHQGLTDTLGQITFSGPDIVAPVTIHISKFCFERTSFVAFDARDVTVFLVPWNDPMCGMGGAPPGGGAGRNGSFVSGELIWARDFGTGPQPWDNVPALCTGTSTGTNTCESLITQETCVADRGCSWRDGWQRVAYVYTTQRAIDIPNPDPAIGGALPRVLETPVGTLGYPYSLFVRPGGLAVYALAGLENAAEGRFVPYVMGVARNVLVGPGQSIEGTNIYMDIPLDHFLEVRLEDLPPERADGPDRFFAMSALDLGGEGVILNRLPRPSPDLNGEPREIVRSRDSTRPFRFTGQPSLEGAIADARFRVEVSWNVGDYFDPDYRTNPSGLFDYFQPMSNAIESGITSVDETLVITGMLGVPRPVAPANGASLPSDRILRWEADGPEPSLYVVLLAGSDGNIAWNLYVPGHVREAPIPDLSTIEGLEDIPGGFMQWGVYAITIPGFDFNTFRYNYLADRYWTRSAVDFWIARR